MTMSLGEVSQVSEGVYAYLQPDGSWYLNNTGFLAGRTGPRHHRRARAMPRGHPPHQGTPAHTTNDSIIHLPERSVVFTGDLLFNGGTPFALQGSVSGWIEVLGTVLRPLGARTLVPGHGPVCGPEVIDDMLAYLRFVRRSAPRARACRAPRRRRGRGSARRLPPPRVAGGGAGGGGGGGAWRGLFPPRNAGR